MRSRNVSVVVVAILTPKPGRLADVIAAFEAVTPKVHEENGCELYAVHSDGETCVMVEQWSSPETLNAHASGAVMEELKLLWSDSLAKPFEAWVVENIPMGEATLGTIR
jgi:quinol monooxygenase YgiN